MNKTIALFVLFIYGPTIFAQTNSYDISFENAVHHEARIKGTFPNIDSDTVSFRMSRTSPGRYALHEFAKNVYNFKATDSKGSSLKVFRPNPHEWQVIGHDGTVTISYTLFANRGDGTYSQIDETHAHLNIPATFMYAPQLSERKIEVNFKIREDLNWKIATQLPLVTGTTYSAPNLQYFMDSPTEISNHDIRKFQVESNNTAYTIKFVLHHNGTPGELDAYFEKVKKVVLTGKEVFGDLPDFDYGTYTFLACYLPNASGDGMEHRNSTIITSTRSLANGGMEGNIGTVSHEFFHAWNVERIRPQSLEPFDFTTANMSGELWFAEGFTTYFTDLILCRAGIITPEQYVEELTESFNHVWNSPAREFFNPIEMSCQAPFVDAATSVDPVNRENAYISYYSYGSVLGLALDLALRQNTLNLDDFMKLVWQKHGKKGIPYTVQNLHEILNQYAGNAFGDNFFNDYIYGSEMPDYDTLFKSVGVVLKQDATAPYFGATISIVGDGTGIIQNNTKIGSAAYKAGLDSGDRITTINNTPLQKGRNFNELLAQFKVGDTLQVAFIRFGVKKTTQVVLEPDPMYSITPMEKEGDQPSKEMLKNRKAWLKIE